MPDLFDPRVQLAAKALKDAGYVIGHVRMAEVVVNALERAGCLVELPEKP